MGKQTFNGMKKIVAILVAVCFMATLTAVSASACDNCGPSYHPSGICIQDSCRFDGNCWWDDVNNCRWEENCWWYAQTSWKWDGQYWCDGNKYWDEDSHNWRNHDDRDECCEKEITAATQITAATMTTTDMTAATKIIAATMTTTDMTKVTTATKVTAATEMMTAESKGALIKFPNFD